MSTDLETQFVELAGGLRHVRTQEGADFFKLPIGALITEAQFEAIKAAKGVDHTKAVSKPGEGVKNVAPNAPHLPNVPGAAGVPSVNTPFVPKNNRNVHSVTAPQPPAPVNAAPAEAPKLKLKIGKSSISGNQHFKVGKAEYNAPAGSKLILSKDTPGLSYVLTPDGKAHAFNEAGEITIPAPLDQIFASKFSGDLKDDPKYSIGEFSAVSAPYGLDQLAPGDKLADVHGNPHFTKQDDGTFKHDLLGATVDQKDIQPLYDKGELVPHKNANEKAGQEAFGQSEATNFGEMSQEEATAALDKMPTGQVVTIGTGAGSSLVKQEDGTWKGTGAHAAKGASSSDIAYLRHSLKLGDHTVPEEDKKSANEPDKKTAPEAEKPAAPTPPAPETKAATPPSEPPVDKKAAPATDGPKETFQNLKHGEQISGHNISQMQKGDQLHHTETGHVYTKDSATGWKTTYASGNKLDSGKTNADMIARANKGEFTKHAPDETKPEAPKEYSPEEHLNIDAIKAHIDQASEGDTLLQKKAVGGDTTWTKNKDGFWENSKTKFEATDKELHILLSDDPKEFSIPEKKAAEPAAKDGKPAGVPEAAVSISAADAEKNSAVGDVIYEHAQNGNVLQWTKVGDDAWQDKLPGMGQKDWTDASLFYQNENKLWHVPAEKPASKPFSELKHGDKIGPEHIDQMREGDAVSTAFSVKTKTKSGGFDHSATATPNDKTPSAADGETIKIAAESGNLKKYVHASTEPKGPQFSELKNGDAITPDHIDQMKPGDKVITNTGKTFKTKQADGSFKSTFIETGKESVSTFSHDEMKDIAGDKDMFKKYVPEEAPKPAEDVKAADLKPLDKITSVEQLTKLESGAGISTHAPGIWVKQQPGMFGKKVVYQNQFTKKTAEPHEFHKDIQDGKVTFENHHTELSAAAPEENSAHPKVGEKIESVEHLDALPSGATLSYTKKDGSESEYSKLENGMYLTPGGGIMPSSNLKNAANQKKFTVKSLPEQQAPAAPAGVEHQPGDKITKYSHLDEMPNGSRVKVGSATLAKNENGKWAFDSPGSNVHGNTYNPSWLADDIKDGEVTYLSGPQGASVSGNKDDVQLGHGGLVLSHEDVTKAIDALEAHTGFQIKYAFKDLTDHPLHGNDDGLAALKKEALSAHPELKPKPAVLAYLKEKAGLDNGLEKAVAEEDNGPKISFGSDTPKKGVQGFDGGQYSEKDVQGALSILEGYNGKLIKSELNKQGNPLGELNPNDLVGFDKDKLVTKQKFIDMLKAKLDGHQSLKREQEELVKHPIIESKEDFAAYPVGTKVRFKGSDPDPTVNFYTKSGDNEWTGEEGQKLKDYQFHGAIEKGKLSVSSIPAATPDYAKTPEAVQANLNDETNNLGFSGKDVPDAPLGTVTAHSESPIVYTKTDTGWQGWNTETQSHVGMISDASMANWIDDGSATKKDIGSPEFNKSGLVPGKYLSKSWKAYMVVKADGSGVFVNTKGDASNITVAKVKSLHAGGTSFYTGMPDSIPTVSAAEKKAPAVKKAASAVELEDGTYFVGVPNDPKTIVYDVEGDKVTVYKPMASVADSGTKIGGKTNQTWLDNAGTGATFQYKWGYGNESSSYVKKDDGKWYNLKGDEASASLLSDAASTWNSYKITGHGVGEPTVTTKDKLKTHFNKGLILDKNGNSVVPKDYTGAVTYFGVQTTIPALIAAHKLAEAQDPKEDASGFEASLKSAGLYYNVPMVKSYITEHYGELNKENKLKFFKDTLGQMIAGVNTDVPDSNAKDLFTYNDLGQPKYPVSVASMSAPAYYSGAKELSDWIKTASASIGDGKIIGQHLGGMDKYDKAQWVQSFQSGNFANLYKLESDAAIAQGKTHVAGYLHPGYGDNSETNVIHWAAAVDGELAAGTPIEGDWSSNTNIASIQEIHNYLIKAQMQNPTHLSASEQRNWVNHHKAGNKSIVDQLSATAQFRKEQGHSPLSDSIQWTDNVEPAKNYTPYFDDTPHPITPWQGYSGGLAAQEYVNDVQDKNPELKALYEQKVNEGGYQPAQAAVTEYFQGKADEAYQKSLIPVYTLTPNQTVKQSTHPVFQYTDQWGKKYYFKPRPDTKLDKYRSEVEHAGNMFGRFFGFGTPDSKLETIDGKYGQLQSDAGGVSDLMGADYGSLSAMQITDIGNEHILDWFLGNDDTKGDNAQILQNGHVVGIDKGRAFKHYGGWNGLSADQKMNSNADTIYSHLYDAIRNGKIDKAEVDKAYLGIMRRAEKMSKASDDRIKEMLQEGMKNRTEYDNSYTIDGKKVPNTFEGLLAAVLDRKNKLPDDIGSMWKKIYKDAGYGDVPEVPDAPLGEDHHSGFDAPLLHEEVLTADSHGKATLLGGGDFHGGSATFWADHNTNGTQNVNMEAFLTPAKQKEVLAYLQQHATNADPSKMDPSGLESKDIYGSAFINAAKTINHHATDGAYNQEKVDLFKNSAELLHGDLEAWTPTLKANKGDSFLFPSGQLIPMNQVDQYKLMLDHYAEMEPKIKTALDNQEKTGIIAAYEPIALGNPPAVFTNGYTGGKLTKLTDGSFIHNDGTGLTKLAADSELGKKAVSGEEGWTPVVAAKQEKSSGPAITFGSTHDLKGTVKDGKLSYSAAKQTSGVSGKEYQITLPTGEKIFFRNTTHTATLKSQAGKLSVRIEGVQSGQDSQAAMQRVMAHLGELGISTDAADHTTAEQTYWREMLQILIERNHSSGSAHEKAYTDLKKKMAALNANESNILDVMNKSMSADEENDYWRELWSTHFGADRVQKLIDSEGYLPKYEGGDLHNMDKPNGKAYWERFDVSVDDLLKSGKVLASNSTNSEGLLGVAKTGSALSTEERIRVLGTYLGGMSSGADQGYGSATHVFTRVKTAENAASHTNFIYHPKALLKTGSYSYNSDNFGDPQYKKSQSPSDPMKVLKSFNNGGNETLIPNAASLANDLEMIIFDDAASHNEAIQYMKSQGIDTIRGLPVEDRIVLRNKANAALKKVMGTWTQAN